MTLAYFDCFAGASGDMIVGALLDAGADFPSLARQLASLGVEGLSVRAETT
ncbi:MAG TPA: TIGR00299 family protein, partial [Phycisphaerales bacterium]|nr:TIGR00299 family protein [Phycisphaerales bacterium]